MHEEYTMEEMIPVVAKLTKWYTKDGSSSVTYETARQLMNAVLYCIEELYQSSEALPVSSRLPVMQAYELGYQKVLARIKRVRTKYNTLLVTFDAWGNDNYKETVEVGIAGFLKYYDPKFHPTDTIIMMDYPLLRPVVGTRLRGIDAIEAYLDGIIQEQKFFQKLPPEYIKKVLTLYQKDYERQYYNLCGIVLRYVLFGILLSNPFQLMGEKEIEEVERYVNSTLPKERKRQLEEILKNMVNQYYDADTELFHYLMGEIPDLCAELQNAAEYHCLRKVFYQ